MQNHLNMLRVGAAQLNPIVGDLPGNAEMIKQAIAKAREQQVQLLAMPELVLCGYPPKDLLLKPQFISEQHRLLETIIPETLGMIVILGMVWGDGDSYNAAAVLHDGALVGVAKKVCLPNYRVFDEKRYFERSDHLSAFKTDAANIGVLICEDLWHPETVSNIASAGVDIIVCVSASPFNVSKCIERDIMVKSRCQDHSLPMVFCNQIGGQDELIFDGRSLIVSSNARIKAQGKAHVEDFITADIHFEEIRRRRLAVPVQRDIIPGDKPGKEPVKIFESKGKTDQFDQQQTKIKTFFMPEEVSLAYDPVPDAYEALVLGIKDYVHKNGFKNVIIGLSGGIDSALTAALACDALGSDHVLGVSMPSQYSSDHSKSDAEQLANNFGMKYEQYAIEDAYQSFATMLHEPFKDTKPDITEENLQARIRGNILMALSNKFGYLVLATGNKSELSVGYATLYGDMCGGMAVLGDVPKTWVYKLSDYCNQKHGKEMIPQNTIDKPPSAELREDQLDTDSLPPYDILDEILHAYIELDWSINEITNLGHERELVQRIVNLVDKAEYKRRQAAVVLRVTSKAFGSDRRLPITNKYQS